MGAATCRSKSEKGVFLSDAMCKGDAVKNSYNPKFDLVEEKKHTKVKLHPTKEKFLERFRIKKLKLPAMGSYDDQKAFKLTQERGLKFALSKA